MRALSCHFLTQADKENRTIDERGRAYLRWLLLAIVIGGFPALARAQGAPDVVWSRDYPTGNTTAVAFAPNGQTVFAGTTDKAANLWRASDGTSLLRVSHGQNGCGTVNDVAYSPDNSLVATINGCTLKLWSVADGALVRTIGIGGGANASFSSVAIAFSPDGQIGASSIAFAFDRGAASL